MVDFINNADKMIQLFLTKVHNTKDEYTIRELLMPGVWHVSSLKLYKQLLYKFRNIQTTNEHFSRLEKHPKQQASMHGDFNFLTVNSLEL